jgi:hypothetical protein
MLSTNASIGIKIFVKRGGNYPIPIMINLGLQRLKTCDIISRYTTLFEYPLRGLHSTYHFTGFATNLSYERILDRLFRSGYIGRYLI